MTTKKKINNIHQRPWIKKLKTKLSPIRRTTETHQNSFPFPKRDSGSLHFHLFMTTKTQRKCFISTPRTRHNSNFHNSQHTFLTSNFYRKIVSMWHKPTRTSWFAILLPSRTNIQNKLRLFFFLSFLFAFWLVDWLTISLEYFSCRFFLLKSDKTVCKSIANQIKWEIVTKRYLV